MSRRKIIRRLKPDYPSRRISEESRTGEREGNRRNKDCESMIFCNRKKKVGGWIGRRRWLRGARRFSERGLIKDRRTDKAGDKVGTKP